ncbi:hypothetical protein [Acanthopleuribacter pedis]|uniref:Uncharacterized protein n=1 Tax=Acanthopleuribacter pedis TaxID=442870 RepID=A0A8J7Q323_9BACT|nr:hypothetical protein [Acanthopleuribacter pedis]MBO1318330.1 hypothetical protein [Acanthopleuribacter pedis]
MKYRFSAESYDHIIFALNEVALDYRKYDVPKPPEVKQAQDEVRASFNHDLYHEKGYQVVFLSESSKKAIYQALDENAFRYHEQVLVKLKEEFESPIL